MKALKEIWEHLQKRKVKPEVFPVKCCLCKVGTVDYCHCGCAAHGNGSYSCDNCNGSEPEILGL